MFSDWLRECRVARDQSQEALAQRARELDPGSRLYQTRISEYERGLAVPSLRQLLTLFAALDASSDDQAAGRMAWERSQLNSTPTASPAGV